MARFVHRQGKSYKTFLRWAKEVIDPVKGKMLVGETKEIHFMGGVLDTDDEEVIVHLRHDMEVREVGEEEVNEDKEGSMSHIEIVKDILSEDGVDVETESIVHTGTRGRRRSK